MRDARFRTVDTADRKLLARAGRAGMPIALRRPEEAAMIVYEVPRHDRERFCRRFSAQRNGDRVVVGASPNTDSAGRWQAFERMSYDPSIDRLSIWTVEEGNTNVVHCDGVRLLTLFQPEREPGYVEARAASDEVLRARFDNRLIAGFLDGVAPGETG